MESLLQEEFEPICLPESKGFLVARGGAKGFFDEVSNWPDMDWVVHCSIVHCYDRIEHKLLRHYLLKWERKLCLCSFGYSFCQN